MAETQTDNVWSVILAAGESEHAKPFIERWLGEPKPNQYCTFVGRRSLFQHTVDRADLLASPERRVVVGSEMHRAELYGQLDGRPQGTVILQPKDCGTAPALFLALAHVRARDPSATVLLFPSDHFYFPEYRFLSSAWQTIWAAERLENRVVLLGAAPENADPDHGWILPGSRLLGNHMGQVLSVSSLMEALDADEAGRAMAQGGLWNTLFIAAKLRSLWKLGRSFPLTMSLFEWIGESLGTPDEAEALQTSFRIMEHIDLAGHLLHRSPDRLAVVPLVEAKWNRWGQPLRILNDICDMGKMPAFPPELAQQVEDRAIGAY
jgi:mannose-1-phosphate guanylyltransferase